MKNRESDLLTGARVGATMEVAELPLDSPRKQEPSAPGIGPVQSPPPGQLGPSGRAEAGLSNGVPNTALFCKAALKSGIPLTPH